MQTTSSFTIRFIPIQNSNCCFEVEVTTNLTNINFIRLSNVNPVILSATGFGNWVPGAVTTSVAWINTNPVTGTFKIGTICFNRNGMPAKIIISASEDNGTTIVQYGGIEVSCPSTPPTCRLNLLPIQGSNCCFEVEVTNNINSVNFVRLSNVNPVILSATSYPGWQLAPVTNVALWKSSSGFTSTFKIGTICFNRHGLPAKIKYLISPDSGATFTCYGEINVTCP